MDNVFYSSKLSLYNKIPNMLSELSQTSRRLLPKPTPKPMEKDHTLNVMLVQSLRKSLSRRESLGISMDEEEKRLKLMQRAYTVAGDRMRDGTGSEFYGYRRYKQSKPSSSLPLPQLSSNHYQVAMTNFMDKYDTSDKPFKESHISSITLDQELESSANPQVTATDHQHTSGYVYSEQLRMLQLRKQRDHTEYRLPKSIYKTASPTETGTSSVTSSRRGSQLSTDSPRNYSTLKSMADLTYKRPDIIIPCHTNVECRYCELYDDDSDHECNKNGTDDNEVEHKEPIAMLTVVAKNLSSNEPTQRKPLSFKKTTKRHKKRVANDAEECVDNLSAARIVPGDNDKLAWISPHPIMQLTRSFTRSSKSLRPKTFDTKDNEIAICISKESQEELNEKEAAVPKINSRFSYSRGEKTIPNLLNSNTPSNSTTSAEQSSQHQATLPGILKPAYQLHYSKTQSGHKPSTVTFSQ